jgi:sugar phosphate isomerase/epimerase
MALGATIAQFAPVDGIDPRIRLGIDQPVGWWPSVPRLKSYEAAGFSHVQVRMPPRLVLADRKLLAKHAGALREIVALTGLELILHAPDDLLAGSDEHDRQLDGALSYASLAGSELVVYHGARVPIGVPGVRARLADERHSLARALRRAGSLGVRLAIENLAPVYPGREFVCYWPGAVAELVRSLDSEHAGMCLDIGHAHIAAGLAGCPLLELIEPELAHVILFHVHDNFGVRPPGPHAGQVEPGRLDLHLPPGAGTVPWAELAPVLSRQGAPLQLEVFPAARPEPATLAILTRELVTAQR